MTIQFIRNRLRASGRGSGGCGERGAACRACRDLQFHTESGATGSRGLQEASAMFFDDAAAGAQRKGRRLVHAFGAEQRGVRGWLRRRIARIVRGKVNQNEAALAVRANEQGGVWSRWRWAMICPARCMQTWRIDWSRRARTEAKERVRGGWNWIPLPVGEQAGARRFAARS